MKNEFICDICGGIGEYFDNLDNVLCFDCMIKDMNENNKTYDDYESVLELEEM